MTRTLIATVALALFAGSLQAAVKLTGVTASASSQEGSARAATHTVNESGFNAATHTVTETDPNNTMWNTANGVAKADTWIKFDMGSSSTILQVWVFNYNDTYENAENRRFVTADIWYSNTGATTNPTDATPGDWTKLTNDQAFTQAPYSTNYNTPDKIDLGLTTRYILFNDIVNNGPTKWGNGYGLSEVEFFIPAPAALPAGLALLGIVAIKRRKA